MRAPRHPLRRAAAPLALAAALTLGHLALARPADAGAPADAGLTAQDQKVVANLELLQELPLLEEMDLFEPPPDGGAP